ncbi:MAG: gephyrin-like molybdotransferase Glp [Pseudomonadota bacterium]
MPSSRKLLDDCFLQDSERMRHGEAIALLKSRLSPVVSSEEVALADAAGRTLALPVTARHPVPYHTNAAVDGYAVSSRHYDKTGGSTFRIVGRAAAGHRLARVVDPCGAVRIFTGAVMPEGFDTVAMQEDCEATGEGEDAAVHIPGGLKAGANVRKAGEDVAEGSTLFAAGEIVRPQDLAALASVGVASVTCFRRLRVAVVSTGDEIIRAGTRPLAQGEVYDANAPMLAALAATAGATVTDLGVWPDLADEVRRRLADAARRFDVILTSGGASRGEEDHMVHAIGEIGIRHLWQLAIKPGRPMSFGQIGDTLVVGLPGNPVAVFVCFLMYVHPMLRRLGGAPWPEPRRLHLPAAFAFPDRKTGRREFWRGTLVETPRGLAVDKFARDGSGLITSLRVADGLIEIPESNTGVQPGDRVAFIPFTEFGILRA